MLVNAGMPAEKSMDFWPSARRVLGRLGPDRARVGLVVALTVGSVGCAVVGPRILGRATDLIFAGVIGQQLPSGITQDQAEAALRARGEGGLADLLSGMTVTPGQGIDRGALASTLMFALGLYAVASLLMLAQGLVLAGVVQRATYQLRSDVEDKLHRLPLRYFDTQPRGELLSRVTNDIDNVQQTMQQTFSQMLNALLTLVGVLTMMVLISPLLAVIALVSVPLSVVVTRLVAKRSQPLFVQQWAHTGRLNAHIEESFTGHAVVRVFGRQDEAEEV
ncbi:MAG TPA: ABC transporter ATP-binding protein, partial [Actinomycetes bacterium]|nr:ABC transporter ATP-binding protein [Actinomycetes bacterium]